LATSHNRPVGVRVALRSAAEAAVRRRARNPSEPSGTVPCNAQNHGGAVRRLRRCPTTEPGRRQHMKVTTRSLASIRPYGNNPRVNDSAVDAVANSIREFGYRQPIVVDEAGVILAGHTRYKAALLLGLSEVPVHVAIGLTPAQAKAYRLADNQTARLAEWDYELLPAELAELKGMDFDLGLTGFSA